MHWVPARPLQYVTGVTSAIHMTRIARNESGHALPHIPMFPPIAASVAFCRATGHGAGSSTRWRWFGGSSIRRCGPTSTSPSTCTCCRARAGRSTRCAGLLLALKRPVATAAKAFLTWRCQCDGLIHLTADNPPRTVFRFWQHGGVCDHNIFCEQTIPSVVEYVLANPVRHGLEEQPSDCEGSSARFWEGRSHVPLAVAPLYLNARPASEESTHRAVVHLYVWGQWSTNRATSIPAGR